MARKRHTPEQIIGKLRAIEVNIHSGLPAEQAVSEVVEAEILVAESKE